MSRFDDLTGADIFGYVNHEDLLFIPMLLDQRRRYVAGDEHDKLRGMVYYSVNSSWVFADALHTVAGIK